MTIEELLKKRANVSARFDLPFLPAELVGQYYQITALDGLPDAEAEKQRDAQRQEFITKHCTVKVGVTRLADAEVDRANRVAMKRSFPLIRAKAPEAMIEFNDQLCDLLWPVIVRHVDKGFELVNGAWQEVPAEAVTPLLGSARLDEQQFLVSGYVEMVQADRKRAEGDPAFLDKAS